MVLQQKNFYILNKSLQNNIIKFYTKGKVTYKLT